MDDAAYVRELFAILTNPSPTGIDAAVVPGEHGVMVELER